MLLNLQRGSARIVGFQPATGFGCVHCTDTTEDTHITRMQKEKNKMYTVQMHTNFQTYGKTTQKNTQIQRAPVSTPSPMSHPLHPHSSILALHTHIPQPGATCEHANTHTHTHTPFPSSQLLCSFPYVSQVNGLRENVRSRGHRDAVQFLPSGRLLSKWHTWLQLFSD